MFSSWSLGLDSGRLGCFSLMAREPPSEPTLGGNRLATPFQADFVGPAIGFLGFTEPLSSVHRTFRLDGAKRRGELRESSVWRGGIRAPPGFPSGPAWPMTLQRKNPPKRPHDPPRQRQQASRPPDPVH